MANVGLKVLDLRKIDDGVIIVEDEKGEIAEFNYILVDRTLDLSFRVNPNNILRLRISELTADRLIVALSGRRGDEKDDKFSEELMELHYAPVLNT